MTLILLWIDFTVWFTHSLFSDSQRKLPPDTTTLYRTSRFIKAILNRAHISCSSLLLALFYITRLRHLSLQKTRRHRRRNRRDLDTHPDEETNDTGSEINENAFKCHRSAARCFGIEHQHRWQVPQLLLVALILAEKYLFDEVYTNAQWSMFARASNTTRSTDSFTLAHINALERQLLKDLDYQIHLSDTAFTQFLDQLEVALTVWRLHFLSCTKTTGESNTSTSTGLSVHEEQHLTNWPLTYRDLLMLSRIESRPLSILLNGLPNTFPGKLRPWNVAALEACRLITQFMGVLCVCYTAASVCLRLLVEYPSFLHAVLDVQTKEPASATATAISPWTSMAYGMMLVPSTTALLLPLSEHMLAAITPTSNAVSTASLACHSQPFLPYHNTLYDISCLKQLHSVDVYVDLTASTATLTAPLLIPALPAIVPLSCPPWLAAQPSTHSYNSVAEIASMYTHRVDINQSSKSSVLDNATLLNSCSTLLTAYS
jgi:hypothetical protein